jgi:hypothetical protein
LGNKDENPDKEDLLDDFLEDEAIPLSDNQQEVEAAWSVPLKAARHSSNFVHMPFIDENGWTRVGTQPIKVYHFVQTALSSTAEATIRASVRSNLVETDSRLPGDESVAQRISDIQLSTFQRFIPHSQDRVEMVCDYTGSISSWSPSPLRISMGAVLTFARRTDQREPTMLSIPRSTRPPPFTRDKSQRQTDRQTDRGTDGTNKLRQLTDSVVYFIDHLIVHFMVQVITHIVRPFHRPFHC